VGTYLPVSRFAAISLSLLALVGAGLATASVAAAEDEGVVYQRYADIRERLLACQLEGSNGWDTATADEKADCRALHRYYVLYGYTGEGYLLHVHCRSAKHCIATPSSEPLASGPMPAGSTVYDVKAEPAVHHRKKRRHHKKRARSGRSRAAHGSAAAAR
jgi:hypothetical protein